MLKRKDVVYYARIQPSLGVYDVLELIVRTVETDWFTAWINVIKGCIYSIIKI